MSNHGVLFILVNQQWHADCYILYFCDVIASANGHKAVDMIISRLHIRDATVSSV